MDRPYRQCAEASHKKDKYKGPEDMAWLVECLPSIQEVLGSIPALNKLDMVQQDCYF